MISNGAQDKAISDACKKSLTEMIEGNYSIMLHEFLYLLCNTQDRLDLIKDNHKVVFGSEKQAI